ncbi:hypothetical protein ACLOJK_003382 [Asimina triloba]
MSTRWGRRERKNPSHGSASRPHPIYFYIARLSLPPPDLQGPHPVRSPVAPVVAVSSSFSPASDRRPGMGSPSPGSPPSLFVSIRPVPIPSPLPSRPLHSLSPCLSFSTRPSSLSLHLDPSRPAPCSAHAVLSVSLPVAGVWVQEWILLSRKTCSGQVASYFPANDSAGPRMDIVIEEDLQWTGLLAR